MIEQLITFDKELFLFINHTLANPVTNLLMPLITSDMVLRVMYGSAMLLVLWKGTKTLRWMVFFSIITLALSDYISAGILKNMIGRIRPCHTIAAEQINLLVGCGGGKSMPSAHAANAFGQAIFWGWRYREVRWYLITFATLVALSRVFVGVHYPADILAGSLLGAVIGLVVITGFNRLSGQVSFFSDKKEGTDGSSD